MSIAEGRYSPFSNTPAAAPPCSSAKGGQRLPPPRPSPLRGETSGEVSISSADEVSLGCWCCRCRWCWCCRREGGPMAACWPEEYISWSLRCFAQRLGSPPVEGCVERWTLRSHSAALFWDETGRGKREGGAEDAGNGMTHGGSTIRGAESFCHQDYTLQPRVGLLHPHAWVFCSRHSQKHALSGSTQAQLQQPTVPVIPPSP